MKKASWKNFYRLEKVSMESSKRFQWRRRRFREVSMESSKYECLQIQKELKVEESDVERGIY